MLIRLGYEIELDCPQPTPMVLSLDLHPDRRADIRWQSGVTSRPMLPMRTYMDQFGNRCRRVVAPQGELIVRYDAVVEDGGMPDPVLDGADEVPVDDLPPETLIYLLGSRYCETDHLSATAWRLFGDMKPGWSRVQAICDFVHDRVSFGYGYARSSRSASQAFEERVGVCRDFAHLAITLCRALNIPARYATGYLGDINVTADSAPMDFSAWFEVYLEGGWHTFDARHNVPRTGRVVVARGRDATDVPILHTFGPHRLTKFEVWSYEQKDEPMAADLRRAPRPAEGTLSLSA
ncbi:transglutaminase-like domain-containing protein [Aliihoeflea sp. PC F10.4]